MLKTPNVHLFLFILLV